MTITLVGLSDAKGDAEKISEAIKSHIDPIPDFKLSFERCEDKEFVVLDVLPGNQTPYYYIGDGQMQAFMRVGNESTGEACFLHRMPLKMRRVPEEAFLSTARIFRTPAGPVRYRMPTRHHSQQPNHHSRHPLSIHSKAPALHLECRGVCYTVIPRNQK